MCHIVTIASIPSENARCVALLNHAQRVLRRSGVHTHSIVARGLPAGDLLHAHRDSEAIQSAGLLLEQAEGVILAMPIYNTTCADALKTFLDLLPQNALAGKMVLPLATGSSNAPLPILEDVLSSVLSALGVAHILRGVYAREAQVEFGHGGLLRLDSDIEQRLTEGLETLTGGSLPYLKGKRPAYAATAITV